MPRSQPRLKQMSSFPITWLSEGKLKSSLLSRHVATKAGKASKAVEYLSQDRFSMAQVESLFRNIREADKGTLTRGSEDYLRCILAKSIAEVLRKETPKYRNEAARKQFFKRLVEIAENCHLSGSTAWIQGVENPSEGDRVLTWVSDEMKSLIAEKADLTGEHSSKLSAARVEFQTYLRKLEEISGLSWQDSERFQRHLCVTSFFPPDVVESEKTWQWGSQWYPELGVLNANPPIMFIDPIRKGILAREAAVLLSPRNLDKMEYAPRILCEQSEYFGYKLLESKFEKEFWLRARHGLRQSTRVRADDLIDFFEYYEMMVGNSLYSEVWARLKEFGDAPLRVADYYIMFNALAARPTQEKFSANEKSLLSLLSKRPEIKAGQVARTLRMSIPTTMKAIRDLSIKAGLRFTIIVDMHKIGLIEYLLLVRTSKHAQALNVLSRLPYCRQVFRTYGSFDLFGVLDIPFQHEGFMMGFIKLLQDKGLVTQYRLLKLAQDFQAVNFDRYDSQTGRWNVHWDTWGIRLRESLSKGDSFRMDLNTASRRFKFDKLDLKILSTLQREGRMPYSTIGRIWGVSGAYVGKKIERMVRENVFRYAVWPLKIAAEDWGVIGISCPTNIAGIVAQYLSDLPAYRGGLVSGDFDGLLSLVWSPSGEMKQLFKAIDDRLIRNDYAVAECMNTIGEWVIARWLPVDPYPWDLSTDEGEWIFDEKRYLSFVA